MISAQPQNAAGGASAISYGASQHTDPAIAAQELYQALNMPNPACVIYFCCVDYDRKILGKALADLFGDVCVIGCTTAGEISPHGILSGSITGFSLSADYFVVEATLLENLATFSERRVYDLVMPMLERMESRCIAPVYEHSFALSLLDGMSIREELVLSALNDALKDIPLVGGSAGDGLHFQGTHIYFNQRFYPNAAAIILVNTICPFTVVSGHHLVPEKEKLVVTKADPAKRIAYEFNAEPAALEYSRVMGLSMNALHSRNFALNPLAVQVGEHFYIRSIQQVNDDLSLKFFCAIDNGIVLTKMRGGGIVDEFRGRMEDIVREMGEPQLVIGYDCIHRRIEAEEHQQIEELSSLYQRYNVVGFNTYGEHNAAMHVNHTFTGVAIGGEE